jgi:hydrogenase maturation protease
MTEEGFNTVLISAGNPFRGDDGVGIAVVRRLRAEVPFGMKVLEESGDGAELLEAWKGADRVILVDAVQSGAPPGTIHRLDARSEKLPVWFSRSSTHAFGVAEAIELARAMEELPAQLVVYAIEGLDFSAGTELSPEVAEVIPSAAHLILQEMLQFPVTRAVRSS